jgi:hypothetical protein
MGDDGDTVTSQGHRRPASDADANRTAYWGRKPGSTKSLALVDRPTTATPTQHPHQTPPRPTPTTPPTPTISQRRMIARSLTLRPLPHVGQNLAGAQAQSQDRAMSVDGSSPGGPPVHAHCLPSQSA